MTKLLRALQQEFRLLHFRLLLVRLIFAIFPPYTAFRLRVLFLRLIGFSIGKESVIFDTPTIVGESDIYSKLIIGKQCRIGPGGYFDLAGAIVIHDRTVIAPQVTIITGTHEIGDSAARTGPDISGDVEVGEGVWIGARCTILSGVHIGNGAVIAAGAVVTRNVPDNTVVGGVPAKVIRELGD